MNEFNKYSAFSSFQDNDDFGRFRDALDAADYSNTGVINVLGVKDIPSIKESDLSLLLHRTKGGTSIETLIRLFLIEVPCSVEAVSQAVHPMTLDRLADAGVVRIENSLVTTEVKLLPFNGLIVAFDLSRMLQTGRRQYYVMGIGSSTLTLANLTVRRPVTSTLDLGTGCGIHAFLAASHSKQVFGVDKNHRAVQLASFNAKLNGLSNVECLEGDLFGPVQGQKFDLIISNPPFVISPERQYIYRDSGMGPDQICRKIVNQAPQFMSEGGYCQILCNWTESKGQDWRKRLQEWFEGTGCDVWVIRSETRDAAIYASTWIRHTEKDEDERSDDRLGKWLTYYDKEGIDAVSAGVIIMRRSNKQRNRFIAEDGPEKMLGPCGDHIVQGFGIHDFLDTVRDDSVLLNSRLLVSPYVRLERKARPSDKGWVDEIIQLNLTRGFAYSGNIDTSMANTVVKCDGKKQLKYLLVEMADSLGARSEEVTPAFCGVVRGLIERGFLLPHDLEDQIK